MCPVEEEAAASSKVETPEGNIYDINNIPGTKRKHLIESGEMKSDSFLTMQNVPGKVLAEMRKQQRINMGIEEKIAAGIVVGSLVKYKKKVYEVKHIGNKGGLDLGIKNKKGKTVFVLPSKVVLITDEDDNESD